MTGAARPPFGAYLHVPFCARRCDYCAFATWADRPHLVDAYLDALAVEVRRALDAGAASTERPITSVFVGGGTPSLVPAPGLAAVLRALPLDHDAEVTIECNPDALSAEALDTYLDAGVNRVSLGVQSMVPSVLRSLGRTHGPGNVERAVELVRAAGVPTFNIDLIYGAVGETIDDWRRSLSETLDLDPPHVSAYGLTVEPGTVLAGDAARHPDDDDQADKYLVAADLLEASGRPWYEISNWARAGHECRHNQLYWEQGEYLAFGCAAHGHVGGRRTWNVRQVERYLERIADGRSPVAGSEVLDADGRRLEALQLALRTRDGVPVEALPVDDPSAALDGLVERRGDHLVLTVAGRLLANHVALQLRTG